MANFLLQVICCFTAFIQRPRNSVKSMYENIFTLLHTASHTITLITWIFNVYSCEVTTSFYLHLPALQRFGPLAAVLRGCDGTTFSLLWGRSVWIDLGPWASQTSTLIPQVAMLRKPFNRPVYMQLCLAIVASCFSGPATESWICIEFVWFVNEKKVMWRVLRFGWRLDFVRFGFVLPLCLGWIASQLWMVQDFSGESCWAPRFIIDLSISM